MRKIKEFLPHLCLSMALAMIVIVILDVRNPLMKFLTSGTSKTYIIAFCVITVIVAIISIFDNRKNG